MRELGFHFLWIESGLRNFVWKIQVTDNVMCNGNDYHIKNNFKNHETEKFNYLNSN